jgi:hypothetical protein
MTPKLPTENLMNEHRVIERMVGVVGRERGRIENTKRSTSDAADRALVPPFFDFSVGN